MNLEESIKILLREFEGDESNSPTNTAENLLKFLPVTNGNKNVFLIRSDSNYDGYSLWIRLQPKNKHILAKLYKVIDDNGYYPAGGWTVDPNSNDYKPIEKFKDTKCKREIAKFLLKGETIIVRLEKIYDDEADLDYNNANYIWHVTPVENLTKIKKQGLQPESNSKMSYHPGRVYITKDKEAAIAIASQLKKFDKKGLSGEYALLKINASNLPNKFHLDPNYGPGAYTDKPIPPTAIEVVEKIKP